MHASELQIEQGPQTISSSTAPASTIKTKKQGRTKCTSDLHKKALWAYEVLHHAKTMNLKLFCILWQCA